MFRDVMGRKCAIHSTFFVLYWGRFRLSKYKGRVPFSANYLAEYQRNLQKRIAVA